MVPLALEGYEIIEHQWEEGVLPQFKMISFNVNKFSIVAVSSALAGKQKDDGADSNQIVLEKSHFLSQLNSLTLSSEMLFLAWTMLVLRSKPIRMNMAFQ